MTKLWIASDHAGVELKAALIKARPDLPWEDLGPASKDSVDYPDFADQVARRVNAEPEGRGVLICGSGQGMALRANKYPRVRAALIWNPEIAALSRQHNDANVFCLGARFHSTEEAQRWLEIFLSTPFEGGRHQGRVDKIGTSLK